MALVTRSRKAEFRMINNDKKIIGTRFQVETITSTRSKYLWGVSDLNDQIKRRNKGINYKRYRVTTFQIRSEWFGRSSRGHPVQRRVWAIDSIVSASFDTVWSLVIIIATYERRMLNFCSRGVSSIWIVLPPFFPLPTFCHEAVRLGGDSTVRRSYDITRCLIKNSSSLIRSRIHSKGEEIKQMRNTSVENERSYLYSSSNGKSYRKRFELFLSQNTRQLIGTSRWKSFIPNFDLILK